MDAAPEMLVSIFPDGFHMLFLFIHFFITKNFWIKKNVLIVVVVFLFLFFIIPVFIYGIFCYDKKK